MFSCCKNLTLRKNIYIKKDFAKRQRVGNLEHFSLTPRDKALKLSACIYSCRGNCGDFWLRKLIAICEMLAFHTPDRSPNNYSSQICMCAQERKRFLVSMWWYLKRLGIMHKPFHWIFRHKTVTELSGLTKEKKISTTNSWAVTKKTTMLLKGNLPKVTNSFRMYMI